MRTASNRSWIPKKTQAIHFVSCEMVTSEKRNSRWLNIRPPEVQKWCWTKLNKNAASPPHPTAIRGLLDAPPHPQITLLCSWDLQNKSCISFKFNHVIQGASWGTTTIASKVEPDRISILNSLQIFPIHKGIWATHTTQTYETTQDHVSRSILCYET